MSKKKLVALILCLSLVLGIGVAAAGGSEGESLISLSFITEFFQVNFFNKANQSSETIKNNAAVNTNAAVDAYKQSASNKIDGIFADAVSQKVIDKITSQPQLITESRMQRVTLAEGDKIVGKPGAGIILETGTGKICGAQGAEVLNITSGSIRKPGADIREGIYYMVLNDDQSGIVVTSKTATAMIKDGAYVVRSYTEKYTQYADILFNLGLFRGTGEGYELVRTPTRQEALIMLIRLLGEENAALAFDEKNTPFTDVYGWVEGQRYIAYGAYKKYTNGISATEFNQSGIADAYMYVTFVLRTLGYKDSGEAPDFVWNTTSLDLAVNLGLMNTKQRDDMKTNGLRRDHVVLISVNALFRTIKGANETLAQKLINMGAITQVQYDKAVEAVLALPGGESIIPSQPSPPPQTDPNDPSAPANPPTPTEPTEPTEPETPINPDNPFWNWKPDDFFS